MRERFSIVDKQLKRPRDVAPSIEEVYSGWNRRVMRWVRRESSWSFFLISLKTVKTRCLFKIESSIFHLNFDYCIDRGLGENIKVPFGYSDAVNLKKTWAYGVQVRDWIRHLLNVSHWDSQGNLFSRVWPSPFFLPKSFLKSPSGFFSEINLWNSEIRYFEMLMLKYY